MSKIIIVVNGGLVESVYTRRKDIEIEVLDLYLRDNVDPRNPEEIDESRYINRRIKQVENSKTYRDVR